MINWIPFSSGVEFPSLHQKILRLQHLQGERSRGKITAYVRNTLSIAGHEYKSTFFMYVASASKLKYKYIYWDRKKTERL